MFKPALSYTFVTNMNRRNIILLLIIAFGIGLGSCKSGSHKVFKPPKSKKCNCPNGF
jgi:hypothetical protein